MENSIINKLFGINTPKQPQIINIKANEAVILSNSVQNVIEVEAEVLEAEIIPDNPFLWEVAERPIYNQFGQVIENYKSIIRDDTNAVLNVCKNSYTPTTNAVLYDTAKQLSVISGLKIIEIKEHKGGEVVAVWLKSDEPIIIGGHQYINYMIVGNSHNSQHKFFVGSYNSMVRCSNQFAKVLHDLRASHTTNNLQQIQNIIRFYRAYEGITKNVISFLEHSELVKLNPNQLYKASLFLFNLSEEERKRSHNFERFQNSLETETKALGSNGLGFFQAVTHFTSHVNRVKDRIYSNIFGNNANLIDKAINYIKGL